MLSYAPPIAHLLAVPFMLVFTGVVQWTLVSDEASAPGSIGEIYGKFGQYTLAYFPWDRAHSIAWLVIGFVVVGMSGIRIALSDTWNDSEQSAVNDNGSADSLVVVSLFLVAIFYIPAVQIARPGWNGIMCAVFAALIMICATVSALIAISVYDPWGRKSIAALLFGELTWGIYAGWLLYCCVIVIAASAERLRYEPDPHWLYRVISAPYKSDDDKMLTASLSKHTDVNPRGSTNKSLLHEPPPGAPVKALAAATMLVPASILLGVGTPGAAPGPNNGRGNVPPPPKRHPAMASARTIRGANYQKRHQLAAELLDVDQLGNLDADALALHEARATTQWLRYKGLFVRHMYRERRQRTLNGPGSDDSGEDSDTSDTSDTGAQDTHRMLVQMQVQSGAGELSWGVFVQASIVACASLALRSPTMPILPFISFSNLVPINNGPRFMGILISLLATFGSATLGVWKWTES